MPSLKQTIVAALIASNLITASVALHYKHQSKENLQNFWQSSAEFERLNKECDDKVSEAVDKVLDETLEACESKIDELQNEISEQAATIRSMKPQLFKGKQAFTYPIRVSFDEMTQEEAEYQADVAEGQQN